MSMNVGGRVSSRGGMRLPHHEHEQERRNRSLTMISNEDSGTACGQLFHYRIVRTEQRLPMG